MQKERYLKGSLRENKNKRHPELDSGSHLVAVLESGEIPYQVRNDKFIFNINAFTLIELLVVVLIIGILAAVALPQYQQAVLKSRVQPYMTLLKTLITAKHTHYLATGQYTYDVNLLDVEMPSSCWETGGGSVGQLWSCGKDFHIDNTGGGIIFYYCPGKNSTHAECMENKELQFAVAQTMAGFGSCAGYTERGRNFCKSFRQLFASY